MTLAELRDQCAFCLRAWNRLWPMRWTVIVGVVFGILISTSLPSEWFDEIFPVVVMQAVVVNQSPTEVTVKLSGKKNRDCKYGGITAYSQVGALLKELNIDRIDRPATDSTHPQGSFDFGTWRIWPTTNTKLVAVYVLYDCGGRQVHVRAAEVVL